MKKIKIYSYAKCSTCRQALKFLAAHGVQPEIIDITEHPPQISELKEALRMVDGQIKRLFNTSGEQYRQLGISQKLPKMSEAEALKILSQNGRLVKRPFLIAPKGSLIGFDPDQWKLIF